MFRSEAKDGELESAVQTVGEIKGGAPPRGVFIVPVPGLQQKLDDWVAMQVLSKDAVHHLTVKVLFHKQCAAAVPVPVHFFMGLV